MQRTFTLKTISAMFMHGAEKQAELRPPSVKGVMRYWFRALAGAYVEHKDLSKFEAQLFGSTDSGAKLIVRCENYANAIQSYSLLPHKGDNFSEAIPSDEEFKIILQPFPGLKQEEQKKILDTASWVLWVAVNLGGFGQRARRGAGSLSITSVEPPIQEMPVVGKTYQNINSLKIDLENGLKTARSVVSQFVEAATVRPLASVEAFPILDKACAEIQITTIAGQDEQEARSTLMFELRDYKNSAFGLPYSKPAENDKAVTRYSDGTPARQASPLHLHLVKPATGHLFLIQTIMRSNFDKRISIDWKKVKLYFNESSRTIHTIVGVTVIL